MAATHAQRRALGDFGERLAVGHLVDGGWTVLDRNWRCPDGEIDIVALDGSTLVVCEVKTRRSVRYGTPFEAITRSKTDRLYRLALAWRRAHHVRAAAMRIDAICVLVTPGGTTVEHVRGVV